LKATADYSDAQGLSFVYFFLKKPSAAIIKEIEDLGGSVVHFFE
jgi:hypothetical protein